MSVACGVNFVEDLLQDLRARKALGYGFVAEANTVQDDILSEREQVFRDDIVATMDQRASARRSSGSRCPAVSRAGSDRRRRRSCKERERERESEEGDVSAGAFFSFV